MLMEEQAKTQEARTFRKAGELAAEYRFKWFEGSWPGYKKGKGHAVDNTEDLLHELAHYLVSPPKYRKHRNFGLGSPGSSLLDPSDIPLHLAKSLEEQASILGIVMCREVGCTYRVCRSIARDHSWDFENSAPLRMEQLQEKGLWSTSRQRIWKRICGNL